MSLSEFLPNIVGEEMNILPSPKHLIRNIIIFGASLCLIFFMTMFILLQCSIIDYLFYIILGVITGGLFSWFLGWIILRFIYPQLTSTLNNESNEVKSHVEEAKDISYEYVLNYDDLIKVVQFDYYHSDQNRRIVEFSRPALIYLIIIEVLLAVIFGILLHNQWSPFAIFSGAVAVLTFVYYIFISIYRQKFIRKIITEKYEQYLSSLISKHRISLSSDGISDLCDSAKSKIAWRNINYLTSTNKWLFIAVKDSIPIIVPIRAFADKETFQKFVELAKIYSS